MPSRQPCALPRLWLITDERQGEALWDALERLPRGGGIVFRHRATAAARRRALFDRVRRVARRRGLLLILAGGARQASAWRADGVYGGDRRASARPLIRIATAHDRREIVAGRHCDIIFLSPLFPTRSHPYARTLGRIGFAALARQAGRPVVALGGMDARRARSIRGHHGWAAIDAWIS